MVDKRFVLFSFVFLLLMGIVSANALLISDVNQNLLLDPFAFSVESASEVIVNDQGYFLRGYVATVSHHDVQGSSMFFISDEVVNSQGQLMAYPVRDNTVDIGTPMTISARPDPFTLPTIVTNFDDYLSQKNINVQRGNYQPSQQQGPSEREPPQVEQPQEPQVSFSQEEFDQILFSPVNVISRDGVVYSADYISSGTDGAGNPYYEYADGTRITRNLQADAYRVEYPAGSDILLETQYDNGDVWVGYETTNANDINSMFIQANGNFDITYASGEREVYTETTYERIVNGEVVEAEEYREDGSYIYNNYQASGRVPSRVEEKSDGTYIEEFKNHPDDIERIVDNGQTVSTFYDPRNSNTLVRTVDSNGVLMSEQFKSGEGIATSTYSDGELQETTFDDTSSADYGISSINYNSDGSMTIYYQNDPTGLVSETQKANGDFVFRYDGSTDNILSRTESSDGSVEITYSGRNDGLQSTTTTVSSNSRETVHTYDDRTETIEQTSGELGFGSSTTTVEYNRISGLVREETVGGVTTYTYSDGQNQQIIVKQDNSYTVNGEPIDGFVMPGSNSYEIQDQGIVLTYDASGSVTRTVIGAEVRPTSNIVRFETGEGWVDGVDHSAAEFRYVYTSGEPVLQIRVEKDGTSTEWVRATDANIDTLSANFDFDSGVTSTLKALGSSSNERDFAQRLATQSESNNNLGKNTISVNGIELTSPSGNDLFTELGTEAAQGYVTYADELDVQVSGSMIPNTEGFTENIDQYISGNDDIPPGKVLVFRFTDESGSSQTIALGSGSSQLRREEVQALFDAGDLESAAIGSWSGGEWVQSGQNIWVSGSMAASAIESETRDQFMALYNQEAQNVNFYAQNPMSVGSAVFDSETNMLTVDGNTVSKWITDESGRVFIWNEDYSNYVPISNAEGDVIIRDAASTFVNEDTVVSTRPAFIQSQMESFSPDAAREITINREVDAFIAGLSGEDQTLARTNREVLIFAAETGTPLSNTFQIQRDTIISAQNRQLDSLIQNNYNAIDADGDGEITENEFNNYIDSQENIRSDVRAQAKDNFDRVSGAYALQLAELSADVRRQVFAGLVSQETDTGSLTTKIRELQALKITAGITEEESEAIDIAIGNLQTRLTYQQKVVLDVDQLNKEIQILNNDITGLQAQIDDLEDSGIDNLVIQEQIDQLKAELAEKRSELSVVQQAQTVVTQRALSAAVAARAQEIAELPGYVAPTDRETLREEYRRLQTSINTLETEVANAQLAERNALRAAQTSGLSDKQIAQAELGGIESVTGINANQIALLQAYLTAKTTVTSTQSQLVLARNYFSQVSISAADVLVTEFVRFEDGNIFIETADGGSTQVNEFAAAELINLLDVASFNGLQQAFEDNQDIELTGFTQCVGRCIVTDTSVVVAKEDGSFQVFDRVGTPAGENSVSGDAVLTLSIARETSGAPMTYVAYTDENTPDVLNFPTMDVRIEQINDQVMVSHNGRARKLVMIFLPVYTTLDQTNEGYLDNMQDVAAVSGFIIEGGYTGLSEDGSINWDRITVSKQAYGYDVGTSMRGRGFVYTSHGTANNPQFEQTTARMFSSDGYGSDAMQENTLSSIEYNINGQEFTIYNLLEEDSDGPISGDYSGTAFDFASSVTAQLHGKTASQLAQELQDGVIGTDSNAQTIPYGSFLARETVGSGDEQTTVTHSLFFNDGEIGGSYAEGVTGVRLQGSTVTHVTTTVTNEDGEQLVRTIPAAELVTHEENGEVTQTGSIRVSQYPPQGTAKAYYWYCDNCNSEGRAAQRRNTQAVRAQLEAESEERFQEKLAQADGRLGEMQIMFTDIITPMAQGFSGLSNWILSDTSAEWQAEVDQAFAPLTSAGWAKGICQSEFNYEPKDTAFIEAVGPGGPEVQSVATISGKCGPPIQNLQNSTDRLYKITGFVRNTNYEAGVNPPDPTDPNNPLGSVQTAINGPMAFKVTLSGPDGDVSLTDDFVALQPGEVFSFSGRNTIAQISNKTYEQVCMEFQNPPEFFNDLDGSSICNTFTCEEATIWSYDEDFEVSEQAATPPITSTEGEVVNTTNANWNTDW